MDKRERDYPFAVLYPVVLVEVLACSLQSDLFSNEVSELVNIIFRDEGHKGMEFCLVGVVPISG